MSMIYKICPATLWRQAEADGVFTGAEVDHADGYIHFSQPTQVAATATKHFSGQRDLLLIGVDAEALGSGLRWEPARGGDLFPHLYGPMPLTAVRSVEPLDWGPDGSPRLPDLK